MATAAELTGEEIAAVAESLSDPANLNVDTMTAIIHWPLSFTALPLASVESL